VFVHLNTVRLSQTRQAETDPIASRGASSQSELLLRRSHSADQRSSYSRW